MSKLYLVNGQECNNPQGVNLTVDGKVLYDPHPKQLDFHQREEPNVLFWGGRGSGKSLSLRMDAHMRAMSHPGFVYILLRRNFPELQKSHLVHIPREMKLLGGSFHYTTKIAHYPNGSRGFFSHCQNEEDVLNLLSAEFAWAGFDELSTFEWDMFTKLSASVRVSPESGLMAMVRAATNPLGPSAQEINQYFVQKDVDPETDPDYNPADWHSIHANLEDNPTGIDHKQYVKRFSGLAPHVRKAWVDGEFVLENALFDFIPTKNDRPYHVVHDIDLPKILSAATIYRALDIGWFPDPTICLWIAHLGNRYIVFHEKLWWKTVASDVAEEIKEIDQELGVGRVAITYADPTIDINTTADVRTIKDIFEENGVPIECSVNKRDMFASSVHTALSEEAGEDLPRIQFYVNGMRGCPYLVKTIPQQRYDQKRPLFMADHKDDHGVVALAYFLISSGSGERRGIVSQRTLRPWQKPPTNVQTVRLGHNQVRER